MSQIKILVFDIDGVITDGKRYLSEDTETKSLSMKDLDAIRQFQESGYIIGCISGEDTDFSEKFVQITHLDQVRLGCKSKDTAFKEMVKQYNLSLREACYIGDGKYDVPALKIAGLALCPSDAIDEVKQVADIVLTRKGGEGCIAESYTLLAKRMCGNAAMDKEWGVVVAQRMQDHLTVLTDLQKEQEYIAGIMEAASMIADSYRRYGRVLICGNGGSAADAQHLAGELVGRFYLERRALDAEALTVNSSVLTAVANDYDYDMVFARQVEAKASEGDILIGITTSGTSENIQKAFKKAKHLGARTILLTGKVARDAKILQVTDCLLSVPAKDTPRIQEMHIMIGHIICELVEREVAEV